MDIKEQARRFEERERILQDRADETIASIEEAAAALTTEWVIEVMKDEITEFRKSIAADKEVHLRIPGHGQIKPTMIEPDGSQVLIIRGEVENVGKSTIIMNISQINFALVEAPGKDSKKQKIPIGFRGNMKEV
ncbi:MAG TPA: hypothetical protein PKM56_17940 [Candidatus Rifleibacterium sp.]|nr:hypothetical protein [Candidatus Rifleibacterium sp.]